MSHNIQENAKKYKYQEIEYALLIAPFGDVTFATSDEDINEHWDVKLINKNKTILTDVKAMKKINREDTDVNENIHYVEIKNVSGNNGWLYGKADNFAFETKTQYVVVDKKPLQDFIAEKCKTKQCCTTPELYKLYRRDNRKDIIVLVETSELIKIARRILPKDPQDMTSRILEIKKQLQTSNRKIQL